MPSKFATGTMVNQHGSPLEWLGMAWQTTPFIHSVGTGVTQTLTVNATARVNAPVVLSVRLSQPAATVHRHQQQPSTDSTTFSAPVVAITAVTIAARQHFVHWV